MLRVLMACAVIVFAATLAEARPPTKFCNEELSLAQPRLDRYLLSRAIRCNDYEVATNLINRSPYIDITTNRNYVYQAADACSVGILKVLLEKNAMIPEYPFNSLLRGDTRRLDNTKCTVQQDVDTVRMLVNAKAPLNRVLRCAITNAMSTQLHIPEVLGVLIEAGLDPNARAHDLDQHGKDKQTNSSHYHFFARYISADMCAAGIATLSTSTKYPPKVDIVDNKGRSPVWYTYFVDDFRGSCSPVWRHSNAEIRRAKSKARMALVQAGFADLPQYANWTKNENCVGY
jgi:hypothetical protein